MSGPIERALTWNIPLPAAARLAVLVRIARGTWTQSLDRALDAAIAAGQRTRARLFSGNPFPNIHPNMCAPSFTNIALPIRAHGAKPALWARTLDGIYFPKVSLSDFATGR